MIINGLNYHVTIKGSGEPLMLLHGFTGSSQNWIEVVEALAEQFQLITIDLPGHGQTDAPAHPERYDMAHVAADLIAVLEALQLPSMNLLGYSMGGRLALYVAVHYPQQIKRLILESASPGLSTAEERLQRKQSDDTLAQRIEEQGIEWFVDYWDSIPLFATQKKLPLQAQIRLREKRLRNSSVGLANSLRGMGTGVQPALWGDLDKLTMPVLLLAGELDTKFSALSDQMAALIPHVRVVKIADAGHTIHLEQQTVFVETLASFLPNP